MRILLAGFALVIVGCAGEGGDSGVSSGHHARPATTCADAFQALSSSEGCTPIIPTGACPPGTRQTIGSEECVSVGVTTCPEGFVPSSTGWGCDVVLPRCEGTQRERLGSNTCAPVTDCGAPFPPPEATLFVKATFTETEVDATHFRTIGAALDAAAAGAVIAIDSGTYTENLAPHQRVSLIGRCAAEVVLEPVDATKMALSYEDVPGAVVKNLTVRGFNAAIAALSGDVTLEGLDIEDSTLAGVVVANYGTKAHLSNVVVRGTRFAPAGTQAFGFIAENGADVDIVDSVFSGNQYIGVAASMADTSVRVTRSIVRDGQPPDGGGLGIGAYVSNGAELVVEESAILDNVGAGFSVQKSGAAIGSGSLYRSVVRGTMLDALHRAGRGVEVNDGSTLVVEQTTVMNSAEIEILAANGANADVHDTTTVGPIDADAAVLGADGIVVAASQATARSVASFGARVGFEARSMSNLTLTDSLVLSTRRGPTAYIGTDWVGPGGTVETGATLALTASTIQGANTAGLLVTGQATLDHVFITGTRPSLDGTAGRGISIQNGAHADISQSALVDNAEAGVVVMMEGASLAIRDAAVRRTGLDQSGHYGIGVLVGGSASATIESTTISDSEGIGLAVAAAGAFVRQSTLSLNQVGVQVQEGTQMQEGAAASTDPLALVISPDTRFVDNVARVGSGAVPLPTTIAPGPK